MPAATRSQMIAIGVCRVSPGGGDAHAERISPTKNLPRRPRIHVALTARVAGRGTGLDSDGRRGLGRSRPGRLSSTRLPVLSSPTLRAS